MMKILLVGNIANNSYNNAKLLRRKGLAADVLCYNYTHALGQPEWEDADFEGEVDQFAPDWHNMDLKGFKRPPWFFQKDILPVFPAKYRPVVYMLKFLTSVLPLPPALMRPNAFVLFLQRYYLRKKLSKKVSPFIKEAFLKPLFYLLFDNDGYSTSFFKQKFKDIYFVNPIYELNRLLSKNPLLEEFNLFFPSRADKLRKSDLLPYMYSLPWLKAVFKPYDIVHACATDPIVAMLATPDKPYVAFEHGTLRELPLEKNAQGRLLSLAYRKARKVIITNPDTLATARKLGLDNCTFIPHPLDEMKYAPRKTRLFKSLREKHHVRHILYSPTRHDWAIKGNDIIIKGFANILSKYRHHIKLIFTSWGYDIPKSKRLIADLGVTDHVEWIPIVHETRNIDLMNASDLVVDQMLLPSFGGIGYKGMSCGKPVITSYRHELNQWCLNDRPPLLSVFNEKDLGEKIIELLENENKRTEIGQKGRKWILENHSSHLISNKLIRVYEEALNG